MAEACLLQLVFWLGLQHLELWFPLLGNAAPRQVQKPLASLQEYLGVEEASLASEVLEEYDPHSTKEGASSVPDALPSKEEAS